MGAKEVHWVIGFPPVKHPCHLGVSIRSEKELIAFKFDGDSKKIANEIGATSVNYISNKGFLMSRHVENKMISGEDLKEIYLKNGGCGGCLTGLWPIDKKGRIKVENV